MQKYILVSLIGVFLSVASFAKENTPFKSTQSLHFLENKGQVKDQDGKVRNDIQFSLSGGGMNVFIGDGALHYQFSKIDGQDVSSRFDKFSRELEKSTTFTYRLDVELIGANKQALASPEGKQPFLTRFYEMSMEETSGTVHVDNSIEAHSYDKVTYRNVYPNIDWVIYSKDDKLEYDFVVKPGGNPKDIKLKYTGATQLKHNSNGSLTAVTPLGIIEEHKPYSFQSDGKEVTSSFKLEGDIVSFKVGNYDGTLTIDPSVIWSSYFGGSNDDLYTGIDADAQGDVYAAGNTNSTANIATNGSTYQGNGLGYNGFVSKFDSDGNLLWATYITGVHSTIWSIATDGQSNAYVAGTSNGFASLGKFSSGGAFVNAVTLGTGGDLGRTVVCDNNNNIYFAGEAGSTTGIATVNAYQPFKDYYADGFIAKLDANMNILWATYYGGEGDDYLRDIDVDNLGNLYVTGRTLSDTSMVTVGPIVVNTTGQYSIFIAKFSPNGNRIWGAMFGGQADEREPAIAVDTMPGGGVYITGHTYSGADIATPGAFKMQLTGSIDAFLTRYDTSGIKLWATYIGGNVGDWLGTLKVHSSGIYLAGATTSTDLPAENGWQSTLNPQFGDGDAMISKFSKSGEHIWSSYYGGSFSDDVFGIDINNAGDIYLVGRTFGGGFLTNTTHQPAFGGGISDGYIVKVSACSQLAEWPIDGDAGICLGDNKIYTVPSSLWTTSTYNWSVTGGITGNSIIDEITVTANTVGNGVITVSANNGCDTISESKNITINPLPVPTISNNGNQLSTGTFITYQWNLNGTPISGATNQDHTASADGDYSVTVTDANGCVGTSAISPVGVATLDKAIASLLIAPNPNEGNFIISGYLPSSNTKVEMEIIDVTGSVIFRTQLKVVNNQLYHPINLEQRIAAGTYYIKLTTDATTQVIRFVKR